MAVTAAKQDIMNTDWHFGTPVYRIEKPEWVSSAIAAGWLSANVTRLWPKHTSRGQARLG